MKKLVVRDIAVIRAFDQWHSCVLTDEGVAKTPMCGCGHYPGPEGYNPRMKLGAVAVTCPKCRSLLEAAGLPKDALYSAKIYCDFYTWGSGRCSNRSIWRKDLGRYEPDVKCDHEEDYISCPFGRSVSEGKP